MSREPVVARRTLAPTLRRACVLAVSAWLVSGCVFPDDFAADEVDDVLPDTLVSGDTTDTLDASDADTAPDDADMVVPDDTTDIGVTCIAPAAECDNDPATVCEANLDSSTQHCGSCGVACTAGEHASPACASGACIEICDELFDDCDEDPDNGCETDLNTTTNCGACGNVCAPNMVCDAGNCASTCSSGTTNCQGACVNTDVSLDHCGGCGQPCVGGPEATPTCNAGTCEVSCTAGFEDCDGDLTTNGCEINTDSNLQHCGGCNVACVDAAHATAACESGDCVQTCEPGFDDCDADPDNGCETDLTADANCGACGNVCGAVPNGVSSCTGDACEVATCDADTFDIDRDPANGCEFTFTAAPALSTTTTPLPDGKVGIGVLSSDNTTRLALPDATITPVRVTSVPPGGANPSISELNNGIITGTWLTSAATTDFAVTLDHRMFGLTSLSGFTFGDLQTYCDGCMNDDAQPPPDAQVVLLQPTNELTPQPHVFVRTQTGTLQWHAYSTVLYSLGADQTECVVGSMFAWTICPVYELAQTGEYIADFEVFEFDGLRYVAVLVDDLMTGNLGVDIYRLDLPNETLVQVNTGGRLDTGLTTSTESQRLAFIEGDANVNPGLLVGTSDQVATFRFTSTSSPANMMVETTLPVVSDIVDLIALDPTTMLVLTSLSSAGSVFAFHSSPTRSPDQATVVLELQSPTRRLRHVLQDPVSPDQVYLQYPPSLEAYTWSLAAP